MKKHKLLSVMLAALFTVLTLMLLVRLPVNAPYVTVTEKNGIYDLTKVLDSDTSVIRLTPNHIYYPNTYLMPENADSITPESTSYFEKLRADYLSQRFILLFPNNAVHTLTFRLSGRHAMRVYVNGELSGKTGRLGTNKLDTEVWENIISVNAAPKDGKWILSSTAPSFITQKEERLLQN